MASLRAFLVALFIFAVAFDPSSVNAKFSKSMYFYWGAHNSAILGDGDDLQLVLNQAWYIDNVPIRVFRNYENEGIAYPNKQGMRVYSSLWNADNWATQGGRVKIDWTVAPFIARYRNFRARACKWNGLVSINQCAANTPANWWTSPAYSKLSDARLGQMKWVRDNYMIYNYCNDTKRFNGQMPPECFKAQF
ncbi:hypothetical protein D5086_032056 [Populus alba]|uniref:Uncharacterized protein n=1 Tax=Populus alba TaxID=43335 RepID=A0ACC4AKA0_POPAL